MRPFIEFLLQTLTQPIGRVALAAVLLLGGNVVADAILQMADALQLRRFAAAVGEGFQAGAGFGGGGLFETVIRRIAVFAAEGRSSMRLLDAGLRAVDFAARDDSGGMRGGGLFETVIWRIAVFAAKGRGSMRLLDASGGAVDFADGFAARGDSGGKGGGGHAQAPVVKGRRVSVRRDRVRGGGAVPPLTSTPTLTAIARQ